MKSAWGGTLAFLFMLVCTGCPAPEPATEVLVLVDSNLNVPEEIDTLRIRVLSEDGKRERRNQRLALGSLAKTASGGPFPFSFSLSSPDGLATPFRLVLTGINSAAKTDADREVVEAQAKAAFTPGQRMVLRVELLRSCANMLCREGPAVGNDSCVRGACGPVPRPPLVPDDGRTIDIDPATEEAGTKPDASMRADAGDDGGSPSRPDAGMGEPPPPDASTMRCEADAGCAAMIVGASPEGCAVAVCMDGRCVLRADDADKDGHPAAACTVPGRDVQLGDDCDDAAAERHPGAWDGPEADGKPDGCDTKDNDCDGTVDEEVTAGKSCTCDPVRDSAVNCSERPDGTPIAWPMGSPLGNCRFGKRSCVDGAFTACMGAVEPGPKDSCAPGDDADCDGLVNEDCTCANGATQPCGSAQGDCEQGTQTCQNGAWSACTGGVGPRGADTCDPGSDRDCDGMANEGCECVTGTQAPCGMAVGARGDCASQMVTCVAGRWRRQDCQPRSEELCNNDNRDENCNGTVNEWRSCRCTNGARWSCLLALGAAGTCGVRGTTLCTNGQWGACSVQPQERDSCRPADITGAGDENCNGTPNEGCCTVGEVQSCGCNGNGMPMGMRTCEADRQFGQCVCPGPEPDPPATMLIL